MQSQVEILGTEKIGKERRPVYYSQKTKRVFCPRWGVIEAVDLILRVDNVVAAKKRFGEIAEKEPKRFFSF